MNQIKIGNKYEQMFAKWLSHRGYWCHVFAKKTDGSQPCDVVALKGNTNALIDVKHTFKNVFEFSRAEANQQGCFTLANACGVKITGFAIYFDNIGKFKWLPFQVFKEHCQYASSVSADDLDDIDEVFI